ncbi:MAG: cupin domain-containing protein [Solirubrobacterales bacterium]
MKSSSPELLEVEVSYGPGGEPPPKHLHPAQDEHFEVLEGSIRVRSDGEEKDVDTGETIDIPRRTAHQIWNPSDAPARVRWQTRPALRTLEWFEAIDGLHREGKVTGAGTPKPAAMVPLLVKYRDVFRLAFRG